MADLTDAALHALVAANPERGWRAFVDQYTATLVSLIQRAGVTDRDDVADLYVWICERLAADDCARLRRHDPRKGALAAWLTIVVRHAIVDWTRSRHGRRRLFAALEQLDDRHQRVFELYYWEHRRATEIAEMLTQAYGTRVGVGDVLDALAVIEEQLSDRHRAELLALMARNRTPLSLDDEDAFPGLTLVDRQPDPEGALRMKQVDDALTSALADLPAEDAAIVRLKFVQGWALSDIRHALHLSPDALSTGRLSRIVTTLRDRLASRGITGQDATSPGMTRRSRERPPQ